MMTVTPEQIRDYIIAKLACEYIDVDGDGQHFFAIIVSHAFIDKTQIARQRLVYAALGNRMHSEIHALSMQTLTPAEYADTVNKAHQAKQTSAQTAPPIH